MLIVFCLFSSFLSAQSQHIIKDMWMESLVSKDSVALDDIIANNAVIIHSNGLAESKAENIHNVMSGKIIYSKMDIKECTHKYHLQKRIYKGTVEVTGKYEGKDFVVMLHYTETYRKIKGMWKLSKWQSNKVQQNT